MTGEMLAPPWAFNFRRSFRQQPPFPPISSPSLSMLPCACSLRSTQCAALIALATAAGIVRIDTEVHAARKTSSDVAAREMTANVVSTQATFIHYFVQMFAPWLASDDLGQSGGNGTECKVPIAFFLTVGPSKELSCSYSGTAQLRSAPKHSFPYAVGPPWLVRRPTERAYGTKVPHDSVRAGNCFGESQTILLSRRGRHARTTEDRNRSIIFSPRVSPCTANRGLLSARSLRGHGMPAVGGRLAHTQAPSLRARTPLPAPTTFL
jgi:hypothetical protein